MTPNKEKTVTVTQAARNAAAGMADIFDPGIAGYIRRGTADTHGIVQRFARFEADIIAREQAERDTIAGSAGEALREAQFLCDRLDELDWSMTYEEYGRSYNGHVDPSHSRLKGALAALGGQP